MKLCVVGMGYVGQAMFNFFSRRYDVVSYDVNLARSTLSTPEAASDCDVAVVCVPTPSRADGRCDTSIVEDVVSRLDAALIIIKSTVEPGTTNRLGETKPVVFSPEYCGESSYWSPYAWDRDVVESPFFIFGGRRELTTKAVDLYMPIAGPTKRYCQTDALTAELVKYVDNSYFATKIAFCYEVERVCRAAGADYNTVRELWSLDPRVEPMHTAVFGTNTTPFGGKCLPKDILAFASWAAESGYTPELLQEVIRSNERIGKLRKADHDTTRPR